MVKQFWDFSSWQCHLVVFHTKSMVAGEIAIFFSRIWLPNHILPVNRQNFQHLLAKA
jgi:hypothetical protein